MLPTHNVPCRHCGRGSCWVQSLRDGIHQATKIGSRLVSVGAGVRYWADSPAGGQQGWGGRLVVTLLFPK